MRWNELNVGDVVLHRDGSDAWVCVDRSPERSVWEPQASIVVSLIHGRRSHWDGSLIILEEFYELIPKVKEGT